MPSIVQSMGRRLKYGLVAAALVVLAGGGMVLALTKHLPKPQIAFTEGQPAPDFTLNDQDGHPWSLSAQHGSRVVVVFYRGYW